MKEEKKAKLFQSSSSDIPHLFKASRYFYKCDDKCQMFKSFSICAHVVAAAHVNGDLRTFIEYFAVKLIPNFTAISERDMPSGSGRKGGVPKRKKKKATATESTSLHPFLQSQMSSHNLSVQMVQSHLYLIKPWHPHPM
uniref:SWIM-type domain-containing protein n=1 Tax=Amphimedon queenslandica TaxID=400682 RepID=A0A1X7U608_AMPQE